MLSQRDHSAALEYLSRNPRENLLLIDMAQKEGKESDEGIVIQERPTQQDIASMIGTQNSSVTPG